MERLRKLIPYIDQAVVSGGNFTLGLVLVRLFGVETYGIFMVIWLAVLFVLGLHQAMVTQPLMVIHATKKAPSDRLAYFSGLWQLQLKLFILLVPIVLSISWLLSYQYYVPTWSIVLLCLVYVLQDYARKYFFATEAYRLALWSDIRVYASIFIGILLTYILDELSLANLVYITIVSYLIGLFSARIWTLTTHRSYWSEQSQILKEHYNYSKWLAMTALVQWFSSNSFIVAAAALLGPIAVGSLRIGQNIIGLTHIIFLGMENVVPSKASKIYLNDGKHALINFMKNITAKAGVVIGLILLTMATLAPWLLETLYGAEYASYSYVVIGYCILYIFVFLSYPVRFVLRAVHYTQPIFWAYAATALLSSGMAYLVIERWQVVGALGGLIAIQVVSIFIYFLFLNKRWYALPESLSFKTTTS